MKSSCHLILDDLSVQVIVKYIDGAPAAGINVSVEISDRSAGDKYTKYYETSRIGEVKFTLPPVRDDRFQLNLRVSTEHRMNSRQR